MNEPQKRVAIARHWEEYENATEDKVKEHHRKAIAKMQNE